MTDKIEQVEGYESVLRDFADTALDRVRTKAAALVQQDTDVNAICSVLIASRQLYALARFALHRELTSEGVEWSDGIEEFLIKAMSDRADRPFARTAVLGALEGSVRKFMVDELEKEVEAERTEEMLTSQQVDSARANKFVTEPVHGFCYKPGEVVLVVGSAESVEDYITDIRNTAVNLCDDPEIETFAQENGFSTCTKVNLLDKALPADITRKTGLVQLNVGVNKWLNVTNSRTSMEAFLAHLMLSTYGNRCDLLTIDNLQLTHNSLFANETDIYAYSWPNLSAAVKLLRRWAEDNRTVILGGVVVEQGKADQIRDELRERYKDIRGVHVIQPPTPSMESTECLTS
jgi:hypothetical protein